MKHQLVQQFELFWSERDQRERKMLSSAAVVIVLTLVYLIFLDPAISGRQKLQTQIPVLRQQVAEISALSGQQIKLAASLSQIVEPVTKDIVEASLSARGIKTQSLSVTDDIVRIQIQTVAYSNMMDWLLESQRASRLTVEEAKVVALPENGQVSATLILKQQRGGL
ncbi:type II secretion system protein M [Undibacterium jejuense]|uniref:Type II secretion system protein M n=1 Tax=Undibacterium jejuense TaxID=1344949 RepID=A0A923KKB1_9BURK|nr:type II secretion system protein GspM [Undibacterium jejuense]MBC3861690.1 type II secretion system protein M [Undibacterium jejuense]